jgi:cobalt-zinc-cadmium efflux system membrane fusion protein
VKTAATILTIGISAVLAGCNGKSPNVTASAAGPPPTRNALEITADAELMKQVTVGEVPWADVTGQMKLAARVEADETRMARINSPLGGRIVELKVTEGQDVQRGQVLASIHSTELAAAQALFLKAYTQQQLASKAVARAKQLLDAGVIGEAELQRRDAEQQQCATELASSRDQLSVLGMSPEALSQLESTRVIQSVTPIVSTISGRVLERKVTTGQVVQGAETIFVVADLSKVWLVADVPEQSANVLRVGKAVQAEIPAVSAKPVSGQLSFISSIVSPETRTIRARMDLSNESQAYKPAMLATMSLLEGSERRRVLPNQAIVREDNQDSVLVQKGPSTFVLRPVSLGLEFRDVRVLESGIGDKEKIVLQGAFHLNNERKRRAISGE